MSGIGCLRCRVPGHGLLYIDSCTCQVASLYCIAGFVCEVLLCVNYASCRELANFNPAVTLSAHCTCHSSMLVISLSYVSVQILQNRDTFASLPDTKGQRIAMVVQITCTMILQYFSNVANSPKHPCRCDKL